MKSIATVAAATPIIGSLFKSKDVDAAMADHTMYLRGTYFESCTCETICPCLLLLDPTQGYCKALQYPCVGSNSNKHGQIVSHVQLSK